MDVLIERTCPECHGTGGVLRPEDCPLCAGVGSVPSGSPRLLMALSDVIELSAEFDAEDGTSAEDAGVIGRPVSRGDRIRATIRAAMQRPATS